MQEERKWTWCSVQTERVLYGNAPICSRLKVMHCLLLGDALGVVLVDAHGTVLVDSLGVVLVDPLIVCNPS